MNGICTVYVVDDDVSVRTSICMMLDAAGFPNRAFAGADEFLAACTPDTCGCIILDVNMPRMSGPELQDELSRRGIKLPIIFLSGQGTIPLSVKAMKSGALDFLTKPVKGMVLLDRVRDALKQCSILLDQAQAARRLASLSARERMVMKMVVEGKTSKDIARLLGISYRTVEVYRTRIMQKTGAANGMELARIVLKTAGSQIDRGENP
jgi:FixJ family two-component response regulator